MLKSQDSVIYKQIQARYCKVVWTHKIQECQADIYLKKSNQHRFYTKISFGLDCFSSTEFQGSGTDLRREKNKIILQWLEKRYGYLVPKTITPHTGR